MKTVSSTIGIYSNQFDRKNSNVSLPLAMRENNVTMWIHSMREGNPDPLTIDLGGNKGFFVFTDVGGDRIERAVFGGYRYDLKELDCYDIFGREEELKRVYPEERSKSYSS